MMPRRKSFGGAFLCRLFQLSYHCVELSAQRGKRDAQQKPERGIGQTDLTHELKRKVRIVPYIHMKKQIHDASEDKFDACYSQSAKQALQQYFSFFYAENCINAAKADSSGECHGPVCVTAPKHLQQTVTRSSERKNKQKIR